MYALTGEYDTDNYILSILNFEDAININQVNKLYNNLLNKKILKTKKFIYDMAGILHYNVYVKPEAYDLLKPFISKKNKHNLQYIYCLEYTFFEFVDEHIFNYINCYGQESYFFPQINRNKYDKLLYNLYFNDLIFKTTVGQMGRSNEEDLDINYVNN
jgi:hypothetical protein